MTPTGGTAAQTTPTGSTETPGATKYNQIEKEEHLSSLGEEIISVATGIRKFVEAWGVTPTTKTNEDLTEEVEMANANMTGNAGRFREKWEEGSEVVVRDGFGSDLGSVLTDAEELPSKVPGDGSENSGPSADSPCLPAPSDWSVCSGKQAKFFSLPNFFNHTSVEEVGAVIQEWAWLTKVGCHHAAEWFLCLLLTPSCPSPPAPLHLPCRSFCHVLQDSCWASLENGRLPVECHLLPEAAQKHGGPTCESVSNSKGNPAGQNVSHQAYILNPMFQRQSVCVAVSFAHCGYFGDIRLS